jgi:hypothetical protein
MIRFGSTRISVLHPTLPHSFGLRVVVPVTFTIAGLPVPVRIYIDQVGFVVGPAVVGLNDISFSGRFGMEQRLLSLLYSRAKAF